MAARRGHRHFQDRRQVVAPIIAAIDAVAGIRPHEAVAILADLLDSDDEDVVEAADEAMVMAAGSLNEDEDDDSSH